LGGLLDLMFVEVFSNLNVCILFTDFFFQNILIELLGMTVL